MGITVKIKVIQHIPKISGLVDGLVQVFPWIHQAKIAGKFAASQIRSVEALPCARPSFEQDVYKRQA